jgi:hypothetical protein
MSGDIDKALAVLSEAGEKATAGPWKDAGTIDQDVEPWGVVVGMRTVGSAWMAHDVLSLRPDDAAFICVARNTWPEILGVLHWARANAEAMECRQDDDCDHCMGLAALAALAAKVCTP